MPKYTLKYMASRIQHTCVSPEAMKSDIEQLCRECIQYGFDAVVVNPIWVRHASTILKGSGVKVCGALNFPIGASTTLSKVWRYGA